MALTRNQARRSLSLIQGGRILQDTNVASLNVTMDPVLVFPKNSERFKVAEHGKSAIAVDIADLEVPELTTNFIYGLQSGGGTVNSVTSGNTDTITIGGTASDPTVAANTAAVTTLSPNLATGSQIAAYVNSVVTSPYQFQGAYNPLTNTPVLASPPVTTIPLSQGDAFVVTQAATAGTSQFFGQALSALDIIVANVNIPAGTTTVLANYTIIERNIDIATETIPGLASFPTSGGLVVDGTGAVSLKTISSTGVYTNANITVDDKGRVVTAASGTAGTMSEWQLSGNSGVSQTVTDANNVQILGGSQITTESSANTTVTINLESSITLTDLTVTNPINADITGSADFVTNPVQPNITSVGTLTNLTVTTPIIADINGNATTATNADFATSAGSANFANNATNATNADFATSATSADSATFATSAGSANFATNATNANVVINAAQTNITSVGTLTNFTSTGIDDNATSNAMTIDSQQNVQFRNGPFFYGSLAHDRAIIEGPGTIPPSDGSISTSVSTFRGTNPGGANTQGPATWIIVIKVNYTVGTYYHNLVGSVVKSTPWWNNAGDAWTPVQLNHHNANPVDVEISFNATPTQAGAVQQLKIRTVDSPSFAFTGNITFTGVKLFQ